MDAAAVGEQAQAVGHGPQLGPERVGAPTEVPADGARRDAAEDDAGLPCGAHGRPQVVDVPHGEQVRDGAAVDPHDVRLEEVAGHVVEVGHREQVEAGDVEPRHAPGLVGPVVHVPRVAGCRADEGHAGPSAVGPGQVDGVVHQGVELELGAAAVAVATRGGEDRRGVGGHGVHPRWAVENPAARVPLRGRLACMDEVGMPWGAADLTGPLRTHGVRRASRARGTCPSRRRSRASSSASCSRVVARARSGPAWPSPTGGGSRSRSSTPRSVRSRPRRERRRCPRGWRRRTSCRSRGASGSPTGGWRW